MISSCERKIKFTTSSAFGVSPAAESWFLATSLLFATTAYFVRRTMRSSRRQLLVRVLRMLHMFANLSGRRPSRGVSLLASLCGGSWYTVIGSKSNWQLITLLGCFIHSHISNVFEANLDLCLIFSSSFLGVCNLGGNISDRFAFGFYRRRMILTARHCKLIQNAVFVGCYLPVSIRLNTHKYPWNQVPLLNCENWIRKTRI